MHKKIRARPGHVATAIAVGLLLALILVCSLAPPWVGAAPRGRPEAADLSWVRTGGPPGGLGYDIRYNWASPNTWYVTDAFAGVYVSNDNGLTWQPSNKGIPAQAGPTGDFTPIFCLTVDPLDAQTLWVGTQHTGHIYRSTDGGSTWEQRDNGVTIDHDLLSFRGFTIDPRSSDTVYAMGETTDDSLGGEAIWAAGTGGVVYRTTDAGANWEEIWDGGMPSSLARYLWIDARGEDDVLYVSTGIFDRGAVGQGDPITDPLGGLGVLKSVDGGDTWRVISETHGLEMLYIGSLYMHPDDPDTLLAAAGHAWTDRVEYLESLINRGLDIPSGIYRTTDGGEHWTHVLKPPVERASEIFSCVEMCPSNPSIAYAGSDLAVYRSEDAGQTWSLVAGGPDGWGSPGVHAGAPIDMQCDPRDTNRVFANNYVGGNFLSEDGGVTWRGASDGYTGAHVVQVYVDPLLPARAYVACRAGIWRTDNGGDSWFGVNNPPKGQGAMGEMYAISGDPSQPGRLLIGHLKGSIMETEDGGTTWEHLWSTQQITGTGTISRIEFAPSNPKVVYAGLAHDSCLLLHEPCGYGLGVIVSVDGGETWQRAVDEDLTAEPVMDLAVNPGDDQSVYAAGETGLFKTDDGGSDWQKLSGLPSGARVRAVAVSTANSQRILAAVDGWGVYVSPDGGSTWQQGHAGLEPNSSIHDIVFDPTNAQVVYVSDYASGMYRSSDGGQTWTKINDGLYMRTVLGLALSADGQHLYSATHGEGVYRLDLNGTPPAPASTATPTLTPSVEATPTATSEPATTPTPTTTAAPTATPTDVPCTNILPHGGFESGIQVPWATAGDSKVTTEQAHGGISSVRLGGDNTATDEVFAGIDLPSEATSITLRYWWYVESSDPEPDSDRLVVVIEPPGSVVTVETITNQSARDGWYLSTFDLTSLAGQTVSLTFHAETNESEPTTFYVDDVELQVCGAAPPERNLFLPLITKGG